jgi:hypothetical protein
MGRVAESNCRTSFRSGQTLIIKVICSFSLKKDQNGPLQIVEPFNFFKGQEKFLPVTLVSEVPEAEPADLAYRSKLGNLQILYLVSG